MPDTAVTYANHLVASGETAKAVALLVDAAAARDVDALMQLAVWHLTGHTVPRDLSKARFLLRRAVSIGHVDAALMEIALTANGSGGVPDWAAAVALLRTAARRDPVAAEHLRLLDAMCIDADGAPRSTPEPETLSTAPHVLRFPNLLTPDECAHVAAVAGSMLEPARVIDPGSGRWIAHPIRTSEGCAIGPAREDLVIRALNRRIALASGTDIDQGEPLTVLRYRPGQQYRLHMDTIQNAANQRIATMLIYLNEGFIGGETHFPAADVTVKPRGGDAIVFTNILQDGTPDPRSRHAGLPVRHGVKWLATRWIRTTAVDPWSIN